MIAAIFLSGLPCEKRIPIENFQFDHIDEVKEKLTQLQRGYTEGVIWVKPAIVTNPKTGNKLKTLYTTTDCDFNYIAFLGVKIKSEALQK